MDTVTQRGAIFVAGASGAIGSAVAARLAAAGFDLFMGYRSRREAVEEAAEIARRSGRRAPAFALDATDLGSTREWVEAGVTALGPPVAVCSCVGWVGPMRPFLQTPPEEWRPILDLELLSGLNLAAAAAPVLIANGGGRLLFLASDAAKSGESGLAVSTAGRGGLAVFAKSLARELARHSVTVNTVCPGPVESPALEALAASELGERLTAALLRAVPLRRPARPEEVAAVFAFLCGADAGYITGQAISVSGGLTMA